jgi:integration host factor subunit alpha
MTKAEIVSAIQAKMGISRKLSGKFTDDLFNEIKKTLLTNEQVKIAGFGVFEVKEKSARPGRNPRTGEDAVVTARRVVKFRASQMLRKTMNNEESKGLDLDNDLDNDLNKDLDKVSSPDLSLDQAPDQTADQTDEEKEEEYQISNENRTLFEL